MMTTGLPWMTHDATDRIKSALAVEGGHLFIHQGGWTLYLAHGIRLALPPSIAPARSP